ELRGDRDRGTLDAHEDRDADVAESSVERIDEWKDELVEGVDQLRGYRKREVTVAEAMALSPEMRAAVAQQARAELAGGSPSDLRSITPEWIERLMGPVVRGEAEYVTPLYARHKYDGTITNTIAYPLTRALYGARVRQPIGGEFGFHAKLARVFVDQPVWET